MPSPIDNHPYQQNSITYKKAHCAELELEDWVKLHISPTLVPNITIITKSQQKTCGTHINDDTTQYVKLPTRRSLMLIGSLYINLKNCTHWSQREHCFFVIICKKKKISPGGLNDTSDSYVMLC